MYHRRLQEVTESSPNGKKDNGEYFFHQRYEDYPQGQTNWPDQSFCRWGLFSLYKYPAGIWDNTQSTDQHQLSVVVTKTQDYNMKSTLILAVIASLLMCQLTSAANDQICNLSVQRGPCKGNISRYYYNRNTGECEQFTFGGCVGNKNNFDTKSSCENTCKSTSALSLCNSVTTTGAAKNSCAASGRCLSRELGPQLRSKPPAFADAASIVLAAGPHRRRQSDLHLHSAPPPSGLSLLWNESSGLEPGEQHTSGFSLLLDRDQICNLPSAKGHCMAYMKRFFYDRNTGECKMFIYGGCQGNSNNFPTKSSCEDTCK
ncbi:carboxypeptidase inhibitor SmCI-like [Rana temporaria]|uniref:carboxypeptidase inhibitor SmCI-like n=1 Tax=Rana temporaria TaxID=8407 RepID=UPI001AACAF1A|nr:carboxypeptidase inhibitor SmCI-like [Rana temporaria]